jgi:hypothetical protein
MKKISAKKFWEKVEGIAGTEACNTIKAGLNIEGTKVEYQVNGYKNPNLAIIEKFNNGCFHYFTIDFPPKMGTVRFEYNSSTNSDYVNGLEDAIKAWNEA